MTTLGEAAKSKAKKPKRKDKMSNLLSQQFVYYEDLKETHNFAANVATKMSVVAQEVRSQETHLGIAQNLRKAANNEFEKEMALLRTKLGINLKIQSEDYGGLIEAINAAVGLKEVYERNKARILAGHAKIDISSLFSEYYASTWEQAFNNNWVNTAAIKAAIDNGDETLLKQNIENLVDEVFNKAMDKMLNSNTLTGQEDLKKVYEDLIRIKGDFHKSGKYGSGIADLYHIDELTETLMAARSSADNTTTQMKQIKGKTRGFVNGVGKNKRVGELKERFLEITINEFAKAAAAGGNAMIEARQIGQYSTKPDVVISYGINLNILNSALQNLPFNASRKDFEKMFEQIGAQLANLSDGFLIYTNAKSYTLQRKTDDKGYKFRGFDGGEGGTLEFLSHVYEKQGGDHVLQFIGAIMNTVEGAMGYFLKGDFENIIAEQIAWFLFDDYKTLGSELQENQANIIHVFDLDGILVPLSVLLRRLADSFERNVENCMKGGKATDVVSVHIKYPNDIIRYPTGNPEGSEDWALEDWIDQRNYALKNIYIATTFFKDFISLIEEIGG